MLFLQHTVHWMQILCVQKNPLWPTTSAKCAMYRTRAHYSECKAKHLTVEKISGFALCFLKAEKNAVCSKRVLSWTVILIDLLSASSFTSNQLDDTWESQIHIFILTNYRYHPQWRTQSIKALRWALRLSLGFEWNQWVQSDWEKRWRRQLLCCCVII